MKVILTDNYDRGEIPERVIAEGLSLEDAKALAASKNAAEHDDTEHYYKVEPEDYELHQGFDYEGVIKEIENDVTGKV